MINFRYHVVSLTAVFLALAIGLVVGTAALNGPAADALEDNVNALRRANQQYRDQVDSLTDQANREEQFVTQAAPLMLTGTLVNRRITLVALPGGHGHVEGVAGMLTMAGAKIIGKLQLQDKFVAPDSSIELLELTDKALPASVPISALPANTEGVEQAGALLAAVLVDRAPAVSPADRQAVLTAFSKAGYLNLGDKPILGSAETVVFVAGLPAVDSQAGGKNSAALTTVVQFSGAGVVVVAGLVGGDEGNLVSEIRDDATLAKSISTVDDASTVQGQLAVALAVREQLVDRKAGHYGVGPKATAMLPTGEK